jgi:hypothetical protein
MMQRSATNMKSNNSRKNNLHTALTAYQIAFDGVPHHWIIKSLQSIWIHNKISFGTMTSHWKTSMCLPACKRESNRNRRYKNIVWIYFKKTHYHQ